MAKYCNQCGKELRDGEVHNCSKETQNKINLETIKSFAKTITKGITEQLIQGKLSETTHELLDSFLIKFFKKSGIGDSGSNTKECFERNKLVTPDSIDLEEGEIPVKQYDAAVLRSPFKLQKAEGRMQITNKRLLFRANGYSPAGKITYQHSFALDKIDGVEIRQDNRFRLPAFLFILFVIPTLGFGLGAGLGSLVLETNWFVELLCLLLSIALFIPYFKMKKNFLLKYLFLSCSASYSVYVIVNSHFSRYSPIFTFLYIPIVLLATILMISCIIFYCVRPNMVIEVKTSAGSPAVQIKHKYTSVIWHKSEEFSGFAEVMPGKDADLVIKEISTIIDDIKTLGDLGVEKWKHD